MAQQGQQLEDQQIMQHFIYPHSKTALQELEQKICDDFDIAEYELEEAVTEYCEDSDLTACKSYQEAHYEVRGRVSRTR